MTEKVFTYAVALALAYVLVAGVRYHMERLESAIVARMEGLR